jgi:hypothetical protein
MKYFTPELIAAYGSDDPATWKDAEARWDTACEQYSATLASLKTMFPPGLRRLEENYALHDAAIRGMGRDDKAFVFVLQLDAPPRSLLTLTYDLVEKSTVHPEVLPSECRGTGDAIEWQYDEIEKVSDQPPTWRHSILLSNGWEIVLHFRDVRVEEMQALIPAPHGSTAALPASGLPQTA